MADVAWVERARFRVELREAWAQVVTLLAEAEAQGGGETAALVVELDAAADRLGRATQLFGEVD